ncbi:SDR family oxidoreductase [Spirochaeta cellobiosiphila]|uniref:SDR family oxidoreductase n=1 Tax=Spirochaeta cellobiosiphila TaxID=504483 RepID=UPI0004152653|nr:SDR family oxidoreductase [Spirochaeta cellobiosiphila]
MKKILLAGATGYLGGHILDKLSTSSYDYKVLVRSPGKLDESLKGTDKVILGEVTKKKTLEGCCQDIDIVISSIGITRQKDGLTYYDVDYQGNKNLLEEAVKSGVKKFIYISALNAPKYRELKILDAKEKFVDDLKQSGIAYQVIRPNGFYSDITEIFNMAKNGRVYLLGNGEQLANPISGEDLGEYVLSQIESSDTDLDIGGPQVLSQNEIAKLAFDALGKKTRISYMPVGMAKFIIKVLHLFTSMKTYGPIEFFLTVMTVDMVAPPTGQITLGDYFKSLANKKAP